MQMSYYAINSEDWDMDQLKKAREEIDQVDQEMAKLFLRRMKAVEAVSDYKQLHGLPVFDAEREEAVVRKNSSRFEEEEIRPYYVEFLRDTMKASRHYQEKRLNGMRVAFCGVEGAFASIAAHKIFPNAKQVSCPDFLSAYDSVLTGDCDVVVLPIENSTAGEVGQVIDRMFSGALLVTGVYDFSISHHLLALPGANMSSIKKVISHPQALAQCASYIRAHQYQEQEAVNTALAAKEVAAMGDLSVAAIASEETAELYGLEILEKNINEIKNNTTRFAVLSRSAIADSSKDKHSILMFTVQNQVGSLAKAIAIIGEHGYNMRCLRSRPMKELLWEYYFYVELEGDLQTENGHKLLADLTACCDRLKVLGSFRYPNKLV